MYVKCKLGLFYRYILKNIVDLHTTIRRLLADFLPNNYTKRLIL